MIEMRPDNITMENKEQCLCVQCGLCCDGTLFVGAKASEDDLIQLEKRPMNFNLNANRTHFNLPCFYQSGKCCSIYSSWRPNICSQFVCKTITNFRAQKITFDEAQSVIEKTLLHASRLRSSLAASECNVEQPIGILINVYTNTHAVPDPAILLDYAAFRRRIHLYFHDSFS